MHKLVLAAMLALSSAWAVAETAQEMAVKKMIEPRLGDGAKVDSVAKTPYSGLYEIRIGMAISCTPMRRPNIFLLAAFWIPRPIRIIRRPGSTN